MTTGEPPPSRISFASAGARVAGAYGAPGGASGAPPT
jgi:hypothetical protein